MPKDNINNDGGPYSDGDLGAWSGSGKMSDKDGSPSNSDPGKWTGGGRASGGQSSDGGPYDSGDLGFSKEK